MRRFHVFNYTITDFTDFANQIAVKDNEFYSDDDIVIVNEMSDPQIKDEGTENETKVPSKFTGKQIFFTVTRTELASKKNGLKTGFILLKVKRIKNPAEEIAAAKVD